MPLLGDAPQQQGLLGVANLTDTPGYAPPAGTNQGPVWDAYQSFKSGLFGAPGAFVQHYYDVMGQPNPITGGNAQQPGEISNIDKLATLLSGAAPSSIGSAIAPIEAGGIALGAGPIRAYHGSPYNFDAFDLSKIGTGEGAQAYGHGLYFAGNEDVAKSYRNAGQPTYAGQGPYDVAKQALDQASIFGHTGDTARKFALQYLNDRAAATPVGARQQIYDAMNNFDQLVHNPPGNMYEVNLHADPVSLLDWDKPLSQQGPQVQQALKQLGIDPQPAWHGLVRDPLGANIYESEKLVPGPYRNKVAATQALNSAGIPGIQYLDAGSRAAGDGTRNYVMFDPARIEILRKYGIGGLLAGGASGAGLLGGQQAETP